jgi:hypothetical protein
VARMTTGTSRATTLAVATSTAAGLEFDASSVVFVLAEVPLHAGSQTAHTRAHSAVIVLFPNIRMSAISRL